MKKHKNPWTTVTDFVIHSLVATAIFFAIAIPAVAIDYFVHYLELHNVAAFTLTVLKGLEGAIVLIDAVAVLRYIVVSLYAEFKDK